MNLHRRAFVIGSVAGGLGAAALAPTSSVFADASADFCTAKPSPADALEAYSTVLSDLRAEIAFGALGEVTDELGKCNKLHSDLLEQVKLLEAELPPVPEVRAQVQRLRDLADIGSAQLQMAHAAPQGSVAVLALVSEKLEQQASAILPDGRTALTPKAMGILREIIRLVREYKPAQAELTRSQQTAQARINKLRGMINETYSLLFGAARSVDIANNPKTGQPQAALARADAKLKTDQAIAKLSGLKAEITRREGTPAAMETIATLTALLEGVSLWIQHPNEAALMSLPSPGVGARFEKVAARGAGLNAPHFAQSLEAILKSHCGRGSILTVGSCWTFILKPVQLKIFFGLLAATNKVSAIEAGLSRILRFPLSCSQAVNVTKLAEDLATLV